MNFSELFRVLADTRISPFIGAASAQELFHEAKRIFFIGNGGSAAIASHMAIDWLKTARKTALSFNDGALLTCLSNDFGQDRTFAKALELHRCGPRDLVVAISSSGESHNIISAVDQAGADGAWMITLSGFKPDNSLSRRGDINYHVPSMQYGLVEVAHHAILHSILDEYMRQKNVDTSAARSGEVRAGHSLGSPGAGAVGVRAHPPLDVARGMD